MPEHGFLDVAGDLRLAPGVVLSGQPQFQGCPAGSRVGVPAPTPAPNNHGHVGQPLRVLVLEERLPQFGEMVLPVGLQSSHKLPLVRAGKGRAARRRSRMHKLRLGLPMLYMGEAFESAN